MSVDKPPIMDDMKGINGSRSDHVNGMQNGFASPDKHKSSHKSSSKDKHRDKEREHKSSSSKHNSSSSSRDKDKHSSSKSHSSSSHKSSNRDKDRSDKDRSDKDRSDKDRSDRDKGRSDKDRPRSDKDKDRSSDKPKSESSRDKDKDSRSDKHKSSTSSSNDRKHSKDNHKSSSSSSKDKSSSSSSKDKDRSDKDKHRDKHSSSSRDKHSSRDKSSHSSNKEKQSSTSENFPEKKEDVKPKIEIQEDYEIRNESNLEDVKMSWNNNDNCVDPLANVTASSCDYSLSQFKEEPAEEKMEESEEDIPLAARKKVSNKRKSFASDSEEEKPLSARKAIKTEKKPKIKKEPVYDDEYSEDEVKPKKKVKSKTKVKTEVKSPANNAASPTKRKKKPEEEQEVWKWWEEEKKDDGTKWKFLEHKGPLFAPLYDRLPKNVVFRYDGKEISLSEETEEVAGFYAKMLDHDYTTKKAFNDNFFNDWRKVMNDKEKSVIKDLRKCDFKTMHAFFMDQAEKNRNKSKELKAQLKATNEELQKEYGFCTIDGHKEKIGNFRIEPPGLFRGRGEHPKMGMHKKRVVPEHVIINCSKDSSQPKAPPGHKWKEVRHDNSVTWLASWTENVQGQVKYVMLNPSSKLKGEKDWQKYETARKLAKSIDKIRNTYREEWKAKEMRIRQRAVALYFIDKLALRAGNEKDEDQADTVGCCSLRVEHIELHKEKDGKEYVVVFDFLGKDSIRYYNEVPVEKRVFKNLELFKENKKEGDDLFDRLNTQTMNEHLRDLMPNLTAKVFRTFNASFTLQNQLDELTDPDSTIEEKILSYNRANRAVAVLCNHQRAVPKGHQKSMDALKDKIQVKRNQLDDAEAEMKDVLKMAKKGSVKEKLNADKKKKALQKLKEQLRKLEVQETDRDENKTIALGTSKLNYLDPRISIAWCKKNNVPIEKIYNKTQRDKFRWAIDMATVDYVF